MDSFPVFERNPFSSTDYKAKEQMLQEVEDQLIGIGGWAIQSVKFAGFFPLDISNNPNTLSPISGTSTKSLKLVVMRRLTIYTAYLWTLHFLGVFFIFYGFGASYKTIQASVSKEPEKQSKTPNAFSDEEDNFLATYNGMAMVVVSAFLRFKYLLSPKKTLEFWNQFCNLLQGFHDLKIFQSGNNRHFDGAKSRIKRFSGIFILITLVQTAVMFSYVHRLYGGKGSARGRYLYDNPDKTLSLLFGISSIFLILFVHLQIGLFIWVGFIIEMYATCFKAIGSEIEIEFSKNDGSSKKELWKSVWSKSHHLHQGEESRLSKILELYEKVCESTEELNRFYSFPMIIDVFVSITNSFASIYVINKVLYLYELQQHGAGESESSWDQIFDLLHRLPSHWAFTWRTVRMSLAGNSVTQESLKVVQLLQHAAPKCRWLLNDFTLQNQIQMLVTRASTKPPGISPGNFFTLNKAFVVSLMSVLVTYFFILTEFREKSEGWNSIRKLNFSCQV